MQRGGRTYSLGQEPRRTGPRIPNYALGGGVPSRGTVAYLEERTRASARNADKAHIISPFAALNGLRDPECGGLIWANRGPAKEAFGPLIRRSMCDGRCGGDLPARRSRSGIFWGLFTPLGDRYRPEPLDAAAERHHTRKVRSSCEQGAGPPAAGLLSLPGPGGREPGSVAEPPEIVARHNIVPRAAPVLPAAAGNASGDATRGATFSCGAQP
jgi:hypothetical protein